MIDCSFRGNDRPEFRGQSGQRPREDAARDTTFAASSADPQPTKSGPLLCLFRRVRNRLTASRYILAGTCDRIAARQHNGQSKRQHCDLCHFPLHFSVICTSHFTHLLRLLRSMTMPRRANPCRALRHGRPRLERPFLSGSRPPTPRDNHDTKHRPATGQYTHVRCPRQMHARPEGRIIYITSTGRHYLNNSSRDYLILAVRLLYNHNRNQSPPH